MNTGESLLRRFSDQEQNEKLPAKKKYSRSGKDISISCQEIHLKLVLNLPIKINNCYRDIKFGQFTKKELYTVLKKIKCRKSADLDENTSRNMEDKKICRHSS